jgi:hypothetical protein
MLAGLIAGYTGSRLMKTKRSKLIIRGLASQKFFWLVVGLLVFQAVWIALSGVYPMAFDEDFHFGIIKLYAHHPLPFWSSHPAGSDTFGAVDRDPSYLYHYVMSFPYRIISAITNNQMAQVLTLRFINIGLFSAGLILYRRLLLVSGASKALVNACLMLFVLIPVVPLLAAQISYDNLFLPLIALSMLLAYAVAADSLRFRRVNVWAIGWWLVVALLASLTKYAFLPIFVAEVLILATVGFRSYPSMAKLWQSLGFGVSVVGRVSRYLLLVALVLSGVLFFERFGLNLAHYHTPVPDCDQVLSVKQCSAYGPWARDYTFEQTKSQTYANHNPVVYAARWLDGMWVRTYFAVAGPSVKFETRGPLTIPALSGIVLGLTGLVAVLIAAPKVWRKYDRLAIVLYASTSLLYVFVLWLDEYRAYLKTNQPVAINGRYLLPIIPLVLVVVGLSVRTILIRRAEALKLGVLAIAVVCLLWGGGMLTYVLRSRPAWYWPSSPLSTANNTVRRTLGPVTPGYAHPTQYLP